MLLLLVMSVRPCCFLSVNEKTKTGKRFPREGVSLKLPESPGRGVGRDVALRWIPATNGPQMSHRAVVSHVKSSKNKIIAAITVIISEEPISPSICERKAIAK